MYKLYIKQKVFKITDHYYVYDENQNPIYEVNQHFKLWGKTFHVSKLDNTAAFTINKKMITFLSKFEISFEDGKQIDVYSKLTLFRKHIVLESNDYFLEVRGDVFDYNYDVVNGNNVVGYIAKKIFALSDTFEITVVDPNFEDELIAIMIAVDSIIDDQQVNNNM